MNILIFGATGMVGQGVLRECLLAPDVARVVVVSRTPIAVRHDKFSEIQHRDFFHYDDIAAQLTGFDACFFCLGVSSVGMSEPDYVRQTYDLTLAAATALARLNPQMVFVYVSGARTDSTEQGSMMWARVKGRTENALQRLPFKAAYAFRPGVIQPLHGVRPKVAWYGIIYAVFKPLLPLMRLIWPNLILTTESVGQAMLAAARHGAPKPVLEVSDIEALARRG